MFTWKKYVLEVYKERSFSKAAQNLFISQPSLSARIKKIEEQIGVPLFDRSTSPLQLTEIGKIYIEAAEEILHIEEHVENCINDLNTLKSGHLSIGASNLFAAYALPPLITRFKQQFPNVTIQLTEGNTSLLEAKLMENSLDFVMDNYHYDNDLYSREFFCKEKILLAVPRQFEINNRFTQYQLTYEQIKNRRYPAGQPSFGLQDFSGIPFIMLTPGNDTRTRGDKLCREHGFHPQIILELNQQATAYMAASTQLGATFISDLLVTRLPSFDNLVYYSLSGEASDREVFFYYKKHKYKTRIMEEFIKMMKLSNEDTE